MSSSPRTKNRYFSPLKFHNGIVIFCSNKTKKKIFEHNRVCLNMKYYENLSHYIIPNETVIFIYNVNKHRLYGAYKAKGKCALYYEDTSDLYPCKILLSEIYTFPVSVSLKDIQSYIQFDPPHNLITHHSSIVCKLEKLEIAKIWNLFIQNEDTKHPPSIVAAKKLKNNQTTIAVTINNPTDFPPLASTTHPQQQQPFASSPPQENFSLFHYHDPKTTTMSTDLKSSSSSPSSYDKIYMLFGSRSNSHLISTSLLI
jgi:hypothetical protein